MSFFVCCYLYSRANNICILKFFVVSAMACSVHDLPQSLLETIFDYLDAKDLANTMQVCARWNKVASQPRLWGGERGVINKNL